jgi:hypothetical protein
MQEFLIIGLAGGAVVCVILSVILLRYGVIIDRFPAGEETDRDRSRWSPREFTRISVTVSWLLFIPGAWMALQPSKLLMVGGIALLVGVAIFLITAVIFSMSVLKLMSSGADSNRSSSSKALKSGAKRSRSWFSWLRFTKQGKKPPFRSSELKK